MAMISETQRRQYLDTMGIPIWELRDTPAKSVVEPVTAAPAKAPQTQAPQSEAWAILEAEVRVCQKCRLHETRKQAVLGTGDMKAQWMFVGEAPGVDEDRQGEPFVGKAGQLLNAMIFALGLKREAVYIANVLKCRPPNNRDPRPEEVEQCETYLLRQIELIQPRIIVALGRHAAHSLLKTDKALGRLRNQRLDYHGTPLVVTYHPAYLLRTPSEKRKVWQDLLLAQAIVETP